ncbi:hypothetical protein KJ632_01740 [Patescibacteria group bacterium]|nr:hypothetical protein [Patescibacteria group bacterium]
MNELENFLTLYLVKKAPFTIPARIREKLVIIAPWIDLIFVVLFLPVLFVLLGLNFMYFAPVWLMGTHMYGWGAATIIAFATFILEVVAIPGLFKRKKYAWRLLMYSSLLVIISDLVFFSFGGILGGIIGLYFLFQIKEYYK